MKVFVFLASLIGIASFAVANPRGSKSVRGHADRKLQQMNKDPVGGGGGAGQGEEGDGSDVGIVELHGCIEDPQVAIDFIVDVGSSAVGDQSCLEDPVNGCPGGCCRMGNWFVCDLDNSHPSLPCVCNADTATVVELDASGVVGNATMLINATATGNITTATAEAPASAPLTPEEFASLYPDVLDNIALQESAPLPNGAPSTATDSPAEDEVGADKKDKRVRMGIRS